MPGKLIATLVKQLRKVVYSFSEKPTVQVDDLEMEHFLLYHKLVGSSPENQRAFKDVKNDILHAVKVGSSLQLAAVLKLSPLWWEDKLKSIFAEADKKQAIAVLLPEIDENGSSSNSDPLAHEDWRVRSNAAMALAYLEARQAVPRLIKALDDTTGNGRTAFCHIAYALGKLNTEPARQALRSHLYSDEPWFRVDAAGALAHWPLAEVKQPLMEAMLVSFALSDYMSVAIARCHDASKFVEETNEIIEDGLCEFVIALLEAARQTFSKEVALDANVHVCFAKFKNLAQARKSTLHAHALIQLAQWLLANYDELVERVGKESLPAHEQIEATINKTGGEALEKLVLEILEKGSSETQPGRAESDLRHAIQLAADLQIKAATASLLKLLHNEKRHVDLTVTALGQVGSASNEAAKALSDLARSLMNSKERGARPMSKQPVQEDSPDKARTYWTILKALGNMQTADDLQLLFDASCDFAPDKREQAINSLVNSFLLSGLKSKHDEVIAVVEKALGDPSTSVRTTALIAVGKLRAVNLREQVLKLAESKEVSLSRQAFKTLSDLWDNGSAKEVAESVQAKLLGNTDGYQKERLKEFLASKRT